MRILLTIHCILLIAGASLSIAQPAANGTMVDEILISIPSDQIREAMRISPTPLRVYQRFPTFYLAGTSSASLKTFVKKGMGAFTIDASAWSGSYTIVSSMPEGKVRNYDGLGCAIVYSSADFDIIKSGPEAIHLLRKAGYACTAIERSKIPVDFSRTHLPTGFQENLNDSVATIIALVSDSVYRSYVQGLQDFGTRYWSNANRFSVFNWVKGRFYDAGVVDVVLDSFQYSSTWQANVVATIPGTLYSQSEIIIGGHLDSYSSNLNQAPGADDDASGTALAIEVARVLKQINYQPAFTWRFIGFAAEEAGLRGSASYAQRARAANRDIRVMQNYDMIGNRNQASPDRDVYMVWYTGSEAFSNLHMATMRTYTTLTPIPTTSYRSSSDSWSFYQQNYKTLFVIERDFSPYYHSPNDLIQYMDIPYATEIAKSGLAMALILDRMPPQVAGLQVLDKGDGSSLYVKWDSVQALDLNNYRIQVGTSPGTYTQSYLQTGRTRLLTGLTPGTRYYVGVSIVDLVGREGIIVEEFCTPRVVPMPPAGLIPVQASPGLRLNWRKSLEMDLRGYHVYRSQSSSGPFTRMNTAPLTDTTWVDSTSLPVINYYYLTAIDSLANESVPSDTVNSGQVVSVHEFAAGTPGVFKLYQNYPNPFNPVTNIVFDVGFESVVDLRVYDVLGRELATILNEKKSPGRYSVGWDARNVSSGIYFYTLRAGSFVQTMRMAVVK